MLLGITIYIPLVEMAVRHCPTGKVFWPKKNSKIVKNVRPKTLKWIGHPYVYDLCPFFKLLKMSDIQIFVVLTTAYLQNVWSPFKCLHWIDLILTVMFSNESETLCDSVNNFTGLNKAFLFVSLTYRFE